MQKCNYTSASKRLLANGASHQWRDDVHKEKAKKC